MEFLLAARRWTRSRGANVAVIFALSALPILGVAGFAIDMAQRNSKATAVQNSLDMAGLAAAKFVKDNPNATHAELQAEVDAFFAAELTDVNNANMQGVMVQQTGTHLSLEVEGHMNTSIMHMFGRSTMPLNTESMIALELESKAEIALVLDTSGSMSRPSGSGTQMTVLQEAARGLVDDLVDPTDDRVTVSIVPFSSYVSVGIGMRGANWLRLDPDEIDTWETCQPSEAWRELNCTTTVVPCSGDESQVGPCEQTFCPVDPTALQECVTRTDVRTWHGCVRSRAIGEFRDQGYAGNPVPGFVSPSADSCAPPILALTNNLTDLHDAINDLQPRGDTYIPAGLMWAQRTLSRRSPYHQTQSNTAFFNSGGVQAVILMSDGENSLEPDAWGAHEPFAPGGGALAANNTEFMCRQLRNSGREVYTVAFNISDVATQTMLEECASGPSYYFAATGANQLLSAFEDIRQRLKQEIAVAG